MRAPVISCIISDSIDFYLDYNGKRYFLFNQKYKDSLKRFFENGVVLDDVLNKRGHNGECVRKIVDKLPSYIRYIEHQYDICVLNKTKKKGVKCA